MPTNIIMPQLGESVVEGTVSKWLKREGDRVNEFDPILEVNTDKVDTEIPSPAAGVLLKVLVPEGTTVKAGTVLALIGQPGDERGDGPTNGGQPEIQRLSEPFRLRAEQAEPENLRVSETRQVYPSTVAPRPSQRSEPSPVLDSPIAAAFTKSPGPKGSGEPRAGASVRRDLGFISPVVARLAEEYQVDLQQVPGTGQGGRITKKDMLAFIEARSLPPSEASAVATEAQPLDTQTDLPPWERPGEGDLFRPAELQFGGEDAAAQTQPTGQSQTLRVSDQTLRASETLRVSSPDEDFIPVEGIRKLIAEHMVRSQHAAPHVTTVFEADLSAVLAHQSAHAAEFARDGVTLTLTAYFAAAAVAALKAVPLVNSQWAEDRILLKREINLGLAVALDEGLIVPVVKRADEKSLLGLARDINDLARRARAKALKPDEVQGGTFTITNHGVSGSLFATPIINQPQAGILGVGAMQKRVVVIHDAIAIRPMVYLTLTFDHRVLDGAVADRFMAKLKEALEGWR